MGAVNVLVEGKDDIVFLCRLIEVMRQEQGLEPIDWTIPNPDRKVILNSRKRFGDCFVRIGEEVVAITETGGFAKKPSPAWRLIKTAQREDVRVTQYLILFDADAPRNFLGNDQDFGGVSVRRDYLQSLYSGCGIGFKTFLFPDDAHDGAMEDLAISIIRPDVRFVIDSKWPEFRANVRISCEAAGKSYLDFSAKCALSQFATVFDLDVAKDLYWVAALWNDEIWNWRSSALFPIKNFLRTNLPVLFRV